MRAGPSPSPSTATATTTVVRNGLGAGGMEIERTEASRTDFGDRFSGCRSDHSIQFVLCHGFLLLMECAKRKPVSLREHRHGKVWLLLLLAKRSRRWCKASACRARQFQRGVQTIAQQMVQALDHRPETCRPSTDHRQSAQRDCRVGCLASPANAD